MSRRSKPAKRVPLADPVYNSVDISKFINRIMRRGKKSLAERIFYSTMTKIEERTNEKAMDLFQKALSNATPLLEVKARRIGGSTYQVPIEVKADRGFALASSWLIEAAKTVHITKPLVVSPPSMHLLLLLLLLLLLSLLLLLLLLFAL